MTDVVTIVVAYPRCTPAQGDEGNALALTYRLRLRGVPSRVVVVDEGRLPHGDVVLVGGLDESGLPRLADLLDTGGLTERVADGAVVLGVNAGYVVLGRDFEDADGTTHPGLDLLDVSFWHGPEQTGPVVAECLLPDVPTLSAYWSHRAVAAHGPTNRPLARCTVPAHGGAEGSVAGHVVGTFLHGPVLARNPLLADTILGWVTDAPLSAASEGWAGLVRRQRIGEDAKDPSGWGGLVYSRPSLRRVLASRRRWAQNRG